jgi:uncharacterized protein YlxW (UPF0749 family)
MKRRADGMSDAFIATEQEPDKAEAAISSQVKKAKSKRAVMVYIATLFAVVLFFIMLSYFVQVRNNSELSALHEKNVTAMQNIENLQDENLSLKKEKEELEARLKALESRIDTVAAENANIRRQWQQEVAAVKETDADAYNALLEQYNKMAKKYGFKEYTHD